MGSRVLFLINSLAGGGAERVMASLLSHSTVELRDNEVSFAMLDKEPAAYAPPAGLAVYQLDCRFSLIRSILGVRRLVREIQPDVVVSFLTRANVANVLATRERGLPSVISERVNTSGHHPKTPGGTAAKVLTRLVYPRATAVIAVSQGILDDLAENFSVPRERLHVVANPVDAEAIRAKAEAPLPPEITLAGTEPLVLGVGRLVPNKNFALLLQAFALSGVPGKLAIVGDGPEREALAARAAELGLGGRVLMPGFLANPFPVIKRATVFVLPSNAEGFPNGLVEAMTLSRPVIAANCPSGPSEILAGLRREEAPGLTFAPFGVLSPQNDPNAMAEALRTLFASESQREDYGRLAAARSEDYAPARAKDAYWAIIKGALAQGHASGTSARRIASASRAA